MLSAPPGRRNDRNRAVSQVLYATFGEWFEGFECVVRGAYEETRDATLSSYALRTTHYGLRTRNRLKRRILPPLPPVGGVFLFLLRLLRVLLLRVGGAVEERGLAVALGAGP